MEPAAAVAEAAGSRTRSNLLLLRLAAEVRAAAVDRAEVDV